MIRLGQRLREERLKQGYSLEDIAQATRIRSSFLSAIERGEYQKLPSPAYASGFVKNYASFLNLPVRQTLALFRREFDEEHLYKVLPEGFSQSAIPLTFRIHHKALFVLVLFIALFLFVLYQFRYAVIHPPLTITSPMPGTVVSKREVHVAGRTDPQALVTINGASVVVARDGSFERSLTVFAGDSIITVVAKHRYGKETMIERKVRAL